MLEKGLEKSPVPSGILVVDKPSGPTSHDVVAVVRRVFKTRRVGHAGTLDPMATGVLVVAIEEATKLVPWLTSDDKAYEATLRLGIETDTLDAEGRETARVPLSAALEDALERLEHAGPASAHDGVLARALAHEQARTEQIPPAFSAIRIDGERAHVLARRGDSPEMPARAVAVRALTILGGGLRPEPHVRIALDVAKGYFVRSFARDFAAALGTVAHLTSLRRTRSGAFSLDDATSLDGLWKRQAPTLASSEAEARARVLERRLPLDVGAARALPVSTLSERGVLFARQGKILAPEDLRDPHPAPSAWLDGEGRLVAVGVATESGEGRVLRGFPQRFGAA